MIKVKPKVSAVVPVYNVPKEYLSRCIESLINQSLKEIEIILVDDGTPDTSGKTCDEYAKIDNRIKVIHQENKGLCGARNKGVENASGEWISFVDGDDWIEKDTYEILYKLGTKNRVDIVMFEYVKDYPSKSVVMQYDKYFEDKKIYQTKKELKYLQKMVLNYNAGCATVASKFIKSDFIKENNLYHDEKLRQGAEGIEFNIRLFNYTKKVLFINAPFYHYIYNDESITTVHNEKNHKMVINCFKKIKSEIDNDDSEIMELFYDRMKYVIITTAISGYFSISNKEPYYVQKKNFNRYISDDLVQETLNRKSYTGLDTKRKITYFLIKHRLFAPIKLISSIRFRQKKKEK